MDGGLLLAAAGGDPGLSARQQPQEPGEQVSKQQGEGAAGHPLDNHRRPAGKGGRAGLEEGEDHRRLFQERVRFAAGEPGEDSAADAEYGSSEAPDFAGQPEDHGRHGQGCRPRFAS